jgi:hypothetical protein
VAAESLNIAAAGSSSLPFSRDDRGPRDATTGGQRHCLGGHSGLFCRVLWDVKDRPRFVRVPLACAVGGTVAGVWIISHVVTETGFRHAVPVLLVIAVMFLLGFRRVKEWIDAHAERTPVPSQPNVVALTVGSC